MNSLTKKSITLYGCLICPYVQRVRIALNYLNIPFTYQEVDLLRGEQNSEWYKKINPLSKVPSLVLEDGRIICESLVIVDYLNEVYSGEAQRSLYPTDLVEKANLKQWVSYIDGTLIPKLYNFNTAIKENDLEKVQNIRQEFQDNLRYLLKNTGFLKRREVTGEQDASQSEQNFFWSDQLSLIDIALLPHINNILLVFQEFFPTTSPLEVVNEEDKSLFEAFRQYYEYAFSFPSFQAANYKVDQLPEVSKSQSLSNLGVDDPAKWNYREYLSDFYVNRLQLVQVK